MYDFDRITDRRGSSCVKWDVTAPFGAPPGSDLIPLWIADMDFAVMPQIREALAARAEHPIFGYGIPTPGCLPALCAWYERRHGWRFEPEQVIHGIGVVTMLRFAVEALTEPGGRILVFSPVYDPFFAVVKNTGRVLVDVPLDERDGQYRLDMDRVEAAMRDGISALILCNPHNPVGKVWTREELRALAELCDRYGVCVLSDEVHGDIELDGNRYTPMGLFPQLRPRLVVFTATSKTFNLAGLQQSALVVPDPALRRRVGGALKAAWIHGANTLAFPAMEAAYTYGDVWVDELNAYLTENARYIERRCAESMPEIGLYRQEGTFLRWMDMRCFGKSSGELTRLLGTRYGLGLSSGVNYGAQCDGFMRLNFACPRATLEKGLDALEKYYRDSVALSPGV